IVKLKGYQEKQLNLWKQVTGFTSISDCNGYELTGELAYEYTQASETLLFDIKKNNWSSELCNYFDIKIDLLPGLKQSGSVLGNIKINYIKSLICLNGTHLIIEV